MSTMHAYIRTRVHETYGLDLAEDSPVIAYLADAKAAVHTADRADERPQWVAAAVTADGRLLARAHLTPGDPRSGWGRRYAWDLDDLSQHIDGPVRGLLDPVAALSRAVGERVWEIRLSRLSGPTRAKQAEMDARNAVALAAQRARRAGGEA